MKRKHTPIHDYWHPRVEGQIRHTISCHPEWFNIRNERQQETFVNSLAKRIVGEIAAVCTVAAKRAEVAGNCDGSEGAADGTQLSTDGGEDASTMSFPPNPEGMKAVP